MNRDITAALTRWLSQGVLQIGQVTIVPQEYGGFQLRHLEDGDRDDLELFEDPEEARRIATYTDHGAFRPLRTAPNLRHGWRLRVADVRALRTALDHFYPSMLGVLVSRELDVLPVIPLRDLLERQTGMYAVTKKITDEQAQQMIGRFCNSRTGCLKTILWPISASIPVESHPVSKFDPEVNQTGAPAPAIPLLCHEACNLLVAEARSVVKKAASPSAAI